MIDVSSVAAYDAALTELGSWSTGNAGAGGGQYKGRFVQVFFGLKYWQQQIPSMFSGLGIEAGPLQGFLDDLYAKNGRPATQCVVMLFSGSHVARTGVIGAGNATAQNTWRNHFHLQKGIGCYAEAAELASPTFLNEPRIDCRHLRPVRAGTLRGATCALAPRAPRYRAEDHRKWLKVYADGTNFANVDLNQTDNFAPWIAPSGNRIPVLPFMVATYHAANASLSTGQRAAAGVEPADLAVDFNLSPSEFDVYFDQDPANPHNAALSTHVGTSWSAYSAASVLPPTPPAVVPVPATPAARPPVLGGPPIPPPIANPWWAAEELVQAALDTSGWEAHVVSRQQLGYDVLGDRGGRTIFVEVKSSSGNCSPELTAREWYMATVHGLNYYLAIVENFNPAGPNVINWVADPTRTCASRTRSATMYSIPRSSWRSATVSPP